MEIAYVDLSAKVEHWTKDSAVALSNDDSRVYLVTARVKQRLRRQLLHKHGSRSIRYRILAILVYLVVKEDLANLRQIVIDRDYTGRAAEATIKNLLLDLLRQDRPQVKAGFVRFENIRGSEADTLARKVFEGKTQPDKVVTYRELEAIAAK